MRTGGRRKAVLALAILLAAGAAALGGQREPDPAEPEKKTAAVRSGERTEETDPNQTAPFPSRYDLRETGLSIRVRDQGNLNTCWAFASVTALETSLAGEIREPLSPDHMLHWNPFGLGPDSGGDYSVASAYLLSWTGPVAEADDLYGDDRSPAGLEPVCHVQEIRIPGDKDYDAIKRAVMECGGVQSSLYIPEAAPEGREAFFYNGSRTANHDAVIVGWDDAYPKEKFGPQPERDGAFLCVNSWGETFGDQGFFYVSYEDTQIGRHNVSYAKVETADNYDRIFQADFCGWTGQLGYQSEEAWFASVYRADGAKTAEAAGFYATGPGTEYSVYTALVPEGTGVDSLLAGLGQPGSRKGWMPAASGRLSEAGFYTIPFAVPLELSGDSRFVTAVRISTPGTRQPVAIEYKAGERLGNVDITDGEGYISPDGIRWARAEEKEGCNVCLKVYGNQ